MAEKSKALVPAASDEALAALRESYPVEQGTQRIILPRLSMASQDVTEGKGKTMKVVVEAGTFFKEEESDEKDEEGKKVWNKEELGNSIGGIILFQRKQLRMFDESTEQYTSSTVYDTDDEVVRLFCEKKKVGQGTPEELKKLYQYKDEDGNIKSRLEDNRILYVLYEDRVYQLSLRGSSMFSYFTYSRTLGKKGQVVAEFVTQFSSESMQKGKIAWNKMTFEALRPLNTKEVKDVTEKVKEIRFAIKLEKSQYGAAVSGDSSNGEDDGDKDMKHLVDETKALPGGKKSKDF